YCPGRRRSPARSYESATIEPGSLDLHLRTICGKSGSITGSGDVSSLTANLVQARILGIGANDPVLIRAVTTHAPQMNPWRFIIVRNRFLHEGRYPGNLGAEVVVP